MKTIEREGTENRETELEDVDLYSPEGEKLGADDEPKTKTPFFQRPAIIIVAAVILIVASIWVGSLLLSSMTHETTDDAFVDAHIVTIAPKIAGRIGAVRVKDNQQVRKGDLLVELDPQDAQAAQAEKQAALEMARARERTAQLAAEQAQAHVHTLEAVYASVAASADATAADATKQKSDLQRNSTLVANGAISRQDYEHSRIDTAAAESTLESKKKQLDAAVAYAEEARKQADSAVAQRDAAAADVKQAAATLQQQQLQVSYTKITAPEDGHVTSKAVSTGDYVQVGQALLALVPSDLWVTANFKETQLTNMRPGQPAKIAIDAYPSRKLHGHVDSIQAGSGARFSLLPPENATGNYVKVVQRVPVKIVFDERWDVQRVLGPGMSAVPAVKVKSIFSVIVPVAIGTVLVILLIITGALLWLGRTQRGIA
jgi:membrane fusion protein (multidrug efflux system)